MTAPRSPRLQVVYDRPTSLLELEQTCAAARAQGFRDDATVMPPGFQQASLVITQPTNDQGQPVGPDEPAVIAVDRELEQQQSAHQQRDPGDPWLWFESIAGGRAVAALSDDGWCELARDEVSGRVFVAPAGTEPPDGDGWTVARLAFRGGQS